MKKRILAFILLTLGSFSQAAETSANGAIDASLSVSVPPTTIVVLPDAFSEGDPQNITLQNDNSSPHAQSLVQEWQSVGPQIVDKYVKAGLTRAARFEDLFSVTAYDFATVIKLKTPRVETILERKVLANRYITRLNLLVQIWPHRFSNIIIAGIGRGADVGQIIKSISETNGAIQNSWLKNIKGIVSVGEPRRLIKILNIMQSKGINTDIDKDSEQSIAAAIQNLDNNLRTLTLALTNIRRNLKPGEKMNRSQVSKIYAYYMFSVLGFIEEIAKLQSIHVAAKAFEITALTADVLKSEDFKGKLISFIQLWMARPDKEMTLFLIKELGGPLVAQKIELLSDLFSEGKTYGELPLLGKIYFRAVKDALVQSASNFRSSANHSKNTDDPTELLNTLNQHLSSFGKAINEISNGLMDMKGIPAPQDGIYHVDFADPASPKLDKDLFNAVMRVMTETDNKQRVGL